MKRRRLTDVELSCVLGLQAQYGCCHLDEVHRATGVWLHDEDHTWAECDVMRDSDGVLRLMEREGIA